MEHYTKSYKNVFNQDRSKMFIQLFRKQIHIYKMEGPCIQSRAYESY